ncbi:hypothetical protein ACRAWD_26755 [Caulobacter segnis]
MVDMLETGDHQITLLFQSRLSIGERKPVILHFPFTWPQESDHARRCVLGARPDHAGLLAAARPGLRR